MHVLFVHQNFPAQFGPFAFRLAAQPGWQCTFVNSTQDGSIRGVECVKFALRGGATRTTHYCSRTFENGVWQAHAIYETLAARPDLRPDVVVGHSGFGSTLFLQELYPDVPVINLFEYFYRTTGSDMDFRPEFPPTAIDRLRAQARNAMILLDLDHCTAGYCPTSWQRSRFPAEYQSKLRVIFDGIDTEIWKPMEGQLGQIGNRTIPPGTKIVTYAARGFEAMRGFDIFMRAAQMVAERRSDVLFVVIGKDQVCYGGDLKHTAGKSFKEWVLSQGHYDLERFIFTGPLPETVLARVFDLTDLHVYLTVPFVLSWSLLNAMACGAPVLASDTAPVREIVTDGVTGRLAPFNDPTAFAEQILSALSDPANSRRLAAAGTDLIRTRYSLDVCVPAFDRLLAEHTQGGSQ